MRFFRAHCLRKGAQWNYPLCPFLFAVHALLLFPDTYTTLLKITLLPKQIILTHSDSSFSTLISFVFHSFPDCSLPKRKCKKIGLLDNFACIIQVLRTMIHPHTELQFISEEIGYGVVATSFIPAGTITWVLDRLDREFTPAELRSLEPIYQDILEKYTYRNSRGNYILCWDHGRYVNHSFQSNCLTTAYNFEIAIRDIHPGEQLTDDYGYLNVLMPFRGIDEGTRRKIVYPDDLLRYYKVWDKKISKVFNRIVKVPQPLQSLIEAETWQRVEAVCQGREALESILIHYFRDESITKQVREPEL
jgi:hypothetical protein